VETLQLPVGPKQKVISQTLKNPTKSRGQFRTAEATETCWTEKDGTSKRKRKEMDAQAFEVKMRSSLSQARNR